MQLFKCFQNEKDDKMVGNVENLGMVRAYLHFYQIVCCFLKVWKNYAFVRLSDVLRKNADQVLQAPIRKVAKKCFHNLQKSNKRGRRGSSKTFGSFQYTFCSQLDPMSCLVGIM